jgi:hypothetical protein
VLAAIRAKTGAGVELAHASISPGQAALIYVEGGRYDKYGVNATGAVIDPAIVMSLEPGASPAFATADLQPAVPLELLTRIRRIPGLGRLSDIEADLGRVGPEVEWRMYGFTATRYVGFTATPDGSGLRQLCSTRLPAKLSDGASC